MLGYTNQVSTLMSTSHGDYIPLTAKRYERTSTTCSSPTGLTERHKNERLDDAMYCTPPAPKKKHLARARKQSPKTQNPPKKNKQASTQIEANLHA